jgi:hypothetical protein
MRNQFFQYRRTIIVKKYQARYHYQTVSIDMNTKNHRTQWEIWLCPQIFRRTHFSCRENPYFPMRYHQCFGQTFLRTISRIAYWEPYRSLKLAWGNQSNWRRSKQVAKMTTFQYPRFTGCISNWPIFCKSYKLPSNQTTRRSALNTPKLLLSIAVNRNGSDPSLARGLSVI